MKLTESVSKVGYFILGHIMMGIFYNRKYCSGRYFNGKFGGIAALGWRWASLDGLARFFLKSNRDVPWPVSSRVVVTHPENIKFDPDDLHIFHTFGTYFQAIDATIEIGSGTWIAPNVGLITANHDPMNLAKHLPGKNIVLGKNCWIGMNAMILPGVKLGDHTIVGAGSVVTKSFLEGYCVIAGNPARVIRKLDCVEEQIRQKLENHNESSGSSFL